MRSESDICERLDVLERERDKLNQELRDSLAVRSLWPEAFNHGSVKCTIKDLPSGPVFKIHAGELTGTFDLKDVPARLLKPHRDALKQNHPDLIL